MAVSKFLLKKYLHVLALIFFLTNGRVRIPAIFLLKEECGNILEESWAREGETMSLREQTFKTLHVTDFNLIFLIQGRRKLVYIGPVYVAPWTFASVC